MMNKVYALLMFAAVVCGFAPAQRVVGAVVINEFMSSNGTTQADEDGAFEDWIELYNTGDADVDLSAWGLSDDLGNPFKWRFREGISIEAQGYLVVWASGKDRQPVPDEALPGLLREVWMGIPGTRVSDLTNHPDYPDNPTSRNRVTDFFEAPIDIADQYGQRMHGILIAPATGNYRFWIASDDGGELRLSTDENPGNAVVIAHVPGWTPSRQWTVYASQQSSLIPLVAGGRYYVSALMKEQGGGDNLAVRWQLPNGTIEEPIPASYFETTVTGQLHTNFRIASDGEPLILTRPDGETVDQVEAVPVPRDISYGRQAGGEDEWHYFGDATPGSANTSAPVTFPPTVNISEPRGFKTESFLVTLTASDPGAVIRYTLDGSTPGPSSPVYTEPLSITQTTTLRTSAVEPNMIQLPPKTVTYLFLDDVLQQGSATPPGWPADRAVNNHRMEYGLRAQIVTGDNARLRAGLVAIPSVSLVTDLTNLFHPETGIYSNSNRSHGWERPVSVELIDPVRGEAGEFHIDAGLRLRGAFSRSVSNPKHAFRLMFRSDYGENRLNFPLFDDEGATQYEKVDLRTAQNYSWAFQNDNNNTFVREVFSRDTQRDMGMPYTRSRYYHLYLNGQYWGLYQTQERGDADYAATYLGGDSDDWDCIKTSQPGYTTQASDGNFNAFYALHDIAINQGFSGANANNYWRVRGLNPDGTINPEYPKYVDEDNLINYMLVAHYTGDPDSPVSIWGGFPNNMYGLYNRNSPGGFIWLRHDAEHSLGAHGGYGVGTDTTQAGASFNARSHFNPSTLHQRLMAHPEYRMRFADLVQRHCYGDGVLTPDNAKARVQQRMEQIDLAIIGESARWGRGRTRDATWLPACNAVLNYLDQRRDIIVGHYRNRGWMPDVDAPSFIRANGRLRISANAPFYYMTDGTDPRLSGGGVHPEAVRVDPDGEAPAPRTLVSRGATWRYYDAGTEPPTTGGFTWRDPDYPDAGWNHGPAILGFAGANVVNPVATVTRRWVSGTSGPQVNATYFRHTFEVDSVEDISGFLMEILRDDGVIVHLNGVELFRENMPSGPVTYDTFSSSIVGSPDQNTYFQRLSDAAHLLRPGVNVLAAQVHQCNATSSDIYFDFSLTTTVHGNNYIDLPLHQGIALKARAHDGDEWSALAEISTLDELAEGWAIHEWDFEDPVDYLNPSRTWGGGMLTVIPGDTTMEMRNLAAQGFDTAHLRINEPLGAILHLDLPTTGFEQIQIAYETRRSGQGAGLQTIEYTTDGTQWILLDAYAVEDAEPQLQRFILASVEAADDNPAFAVRITFAQGAGGAAGNNRFDNIQLTGVPLAGTPVPPLVQTPIANRELIENATSALIDLNEVFENPNTDPLVYTAHSEPEGLVDLEVNGSTLTVTPRQRGEAIIAVLASVGDASAPTTFRVLIYPEAHVLAGGPYSFSVWSPDEPAWSYPEHLLFLQSEESDTELDTPLLRAYHIPLEDAAASEDSDFPYRAGTRTRINGLGPEGISLINTGRNRDLGGVLLAVDTRGVNIAPVAWLSGTVLPNTREYAIRLQYRVGQQGPFFDVLDATGQPMEYVTHPTAGHADVVGQGELPPAALGQSYVQLLWRYYRISGDVGPRAELRLDDILVANAPVQPATEFRFANNPPSAWQPNIVLPSITVLAVDDQGFTDLSYSGPVTISIDVGASLSGTLTRQASQGSAVFSDMAISGTGSLRLRASGGGLAVAESTPIQVVDMPVFVHGNDGDWTIDENWTTAIYPDGVDAQAWITTPTAGDRDVILRAPVVIGELTVENNDTSSRNRIRDVSTENTLTFGSSSGTAQLRVVGSGSGWVEFNVEAGTVLANMLEVTVDHLEGNLDDGFGALRLRENWSGPGGLIKKGAGILSMTGGGKDYQGTTIVELGVLSVTESSVPMNTSSVVVQPGGQLRLVSTGESRMYNFGGSLILNSTGRGGGVPSGEGQEVLGALRYEPGGPGNSAEILNGITFTGPSSIHVSNASNSLTLHGSVMGPGTLDKSGGGRLILTGDSEGYVASVRVSTGELWVDGAIGSIVTLDRDTMLRGAGRVGGIVGGGVVAPGPSQATLAAEMLGDGLVTRVQMSSVRNGDVNSLRLTGTAPFGQGLTGASQIQVFLDELPSSGLLVEGGLFTDQPEDFLSRIVQAQVHVFVPDASGEVEHDGLLYSQYVGTVPYTVSTVPVVRNFGAGDVAGRHLRLVFGDVLSATVALDGLAAVYTGNPIEVSVTTDPPGLAVKVTYNGSFELPVDVGSYFVIATVNDPGYVGSAEGTLIIEFDGLVGDGPRLEVVSIGLGDEGEWVSVFDVNALEGVEVILETSTNLDQWDTVEVVVGAGLANSVRVTVTGSAEDPIRFWRLRME